MTTMSDAFEKAGFSKVEMEAYPAAVKFIEAGGTLNSWIRIYNAVAKRMPSKGQITSEIQPTNADARPASSHAPSETPSALAARPLIPYAGKPLRKPAKMPTAGQKQAALEGAAERALTLLDIRKIGGRSIGDIRMREIKAIGRDAADRAVAFLGQGLQDATDAFLCWKISNFAVLAKDDSYVREVTSPSVLGKLDREAAAWAAAKIADEMTNYKKTLFQMPMNESASA